MNLKQGEPVPSPLYLVHSPNRPSSYLGKVYVDKNDALRSADFDEVVIELRLAASAGEGK